MSKFFATLLVIVGALFVVVLGIGSRASVEYSGQKTLIFDQPSEIVWNVVADITKFQERKNDVNTLEILESDSRNRIIEWRENLKLKGFRMYRLVETRQPKRVVFEIIDSHEELTGSWEYLMEEVEGGTKLTIIEQSKINNTFWRGIRAIFGREYFINHEFKWIRVGLFQDLLEG